jgi:hypothetical protein
MPISIPGPHTQRVITRVKNIKRIELLNRLSRLHANNVHVQSAIITRTRELHEAAIAAAEAREDTVEWDGQPLDV